MTAGADNNSETMQLRELLERVVTAYDYETEDRGIELALIRDEARKLGKLETVNDYIAECDKEDKKLIRDERREARLRRQSIPLTLDGRGNPVNSIDNFYNIMTYSEQYDNIRYNVLLNAPEVQGKDGIPRRWTDADEARSKHFIEKNFKIYSESRHSDAMRMLWKDREYNPIKDILAEYEWDGQNRCEHFLTRWANADDTPYTREVSRLIFAGGIARLFSPGIKFDDVPVLIGTRQGEGKSSLVRWLAINDDYYGEAKTIEGQASIEQLEGVWICEFSELLALTKAKEQEAVKSYITSQRDKFRKPYDKNPQEFPRRCIFIGTTNNDQFLVDKTGNRRFYPVTVHCDGYDLYDHEQECREYIIQCWKEAEVRYKKGQMPNFARRDLKKDYELAQESAMQDDWRVGAIGAFLDSRGVGEFTCVREIAHRALSPSQEFPKDPDFRICRDIGQIMTRYYPEWEKAGPHRFLDYGVQKSWRKTGDIAGHDAEEDTDELPF